MCTTRLNEDIMAENGIFIKIKTDRMAVFGTFCLSFEFFSGKFLREMVEV